MIPDEAEAWPSYPNGSMAPILEASIEAAKLRHPSGKATEMLTTEDRCDSCQAAALYRVSAGLHPLDYCLHHWRTYKPRMTEQGWVVIGVNSELAASLGVKETGHG